MDKHPNLNIPVIAALLLIVVRLGFHITDYDPPLFQIIFVFTTVGGLIPLCIYAIWPRKNDTGDFKKEIAQSLRVMLLYAAIMAAFIVVFYAFIDTSYFPEKQANIVRNAIEQDPEANVEKLTKSAKTFFSLRNFSLLMVLGFLAASGFYAIFFTAIKRKFFKNK